MSLHGAQSAQMTQFQIHLFNPLSAVPTALTVTDISCGPTQIQTCSGNAAEQS